MYEVSFLAVPSSVTNHASYAGHLVGRLSPIQ